MTAISLIDMLWTVTSEVTDRSNINGWSHRQMKKPRGLITEQYEQAQTLLMIHRFALETVTQKLLKTETIDGTVVKKALVDTEKD